MSIDPNAQLCYVTYESLYRDIPSYQLRVSLLRTLFHHHLLVS